MKKEQDKEMKLDEMDKVSGGFIDYPDPDPRLSCEDYWKHVKKRETLPPDYYDDDGRD